MRGCGDDGSSGAGEVVAVGSGDALYEAEMAQAADLTGQRRRREFLEKRGQIGAANACDVEFWVPQSANQRALGGIEEIHALDCPRSFAAA